MGRHLNNQYSSIINNNIHLPKLSQTHLQGPFPSLPQRNITLQKLHSPRLQLGGFSWCNVQDEDFSAFFDEFLGDAETETGATACYDCYFSFNSTDHHK